MRNLALFLIGVTLTACSGGDGPSGGGTPIPTTPTPVATEVPPGDGTTVVIGEPGLCNPGDVARVDFPAGSSARFPLVLDDDPCSPAKDNRTEEYTLMLYNTTGGAISFRVDSVINAVPPESPAALGMLDYQGGEPPAPKAPESQPMVQMGPSEMNQIAAAKFEELRATKTPIHYGSSPYRQSRMRAQSVDDEGEFRVRCSVGDVDAFCTTSAILRAQGAHINIYVDRDAPFGTNATACLAFGADSVDCLTQAHLDNIVDVFENNIYPLTINLLGEPSDIDEDERVSVLITPMVNDKLKYASYTDSRNLLEYDPVSNSGSNEGEIIFVIAPDSNGNYTNDDKLKVPADEYAGRFLNAWITFQFSKIVSFNEHVLLRGSSAEDDWIDDGVGAVMADLAGFNLWRPASWVFLAQPHTDDLRGAEDLDEEDDQGNEYLFMLYLLQSQMDTSFEDADGNGLDDDMAVLTRLIQSDITGIENLQAAADFNFEDDVESEFQAMFKDWAIAITTSGSRRGDLQQAGQDEVKYYFNLNPTVYGTAATDGIGNASGSLRYGAVGNEVGIDLNGYHDDDETLLENADEHVWSPGNTMFGYVSPFSVMYVRLTGLFQRQQTLIIKSSSSSLRGFLVARTDVTYPHTYAESIYGSINQYAEDMQTPGPNPYWTNQGNPVKIDLTSLVASSNDGNAFTLESEEPAQDFLSIVGRIDPPGQIEVCPPVGDCVATDVPDTDKYLIDVPDLGRGDEGYLHVVLRRQHGNGSPGSPLSPMLAIVSSKDVPYPYLPHPIRGSVAGNGVVADGELRQQYRWVMDTIVCGDDNGGPVYDPTGGGGACPGDPLTSIETLTQNQMSLNGGLFEPRERIDFQGTPYYVDGILGGECDVSPFPGGFGPNFAYDVTDLEASPSSLDLSLYPYFSNGFPDILFGREVLKNVTGYPSWEPESMYDPRSVNSRSLNCQVTTADEADLAKDSPDDLLEWGELKNASSLAEQILIEMSRGRFYSADGEGSSATGITLESTLLDPKYQDFDKFAIDVDSRDEEKSLSCTEVDLANNANTFTVQEGEGSMLFGNQSILEKHIRQNLDGSDELGIESGDVPADLDCPTVTDGQDVYCPDNSADPLAQFGTGVLLLAPGKSYTIIVADRSGGTGNYELRIRHYNPFRQRSGQLVEHTKEGTCKLGIDEN